MNAKVSYVDEITAKLIGLAPYRIILSGSYARETRTETSDIDLLIVLDSGMMPQSYEEKMKNKLLVRNQIIEINERVPIDIIVYTRAEYDLVAEHATSFFNEMRETGKTLYEKAG